MQFSRLFVLAQLIQQLSVDSSPHPLRRPFQSHPITRAPWHALCAGPDTSQEQFQTHHKTMFQERSGNIPGTDSNLVPRMFQQLTSFKLIQKYDPDIFPEHTFIYLVSAYSGVRLLCNIRQIHPQLDARRALLRRLFEQRFGLTEFT